MFHSVVTNRRQPNQYANMYTYHVPGIESRGGGDNHTEAVRWVLTESVCLWYGGVRAT